MKKTMTKFLMVPLVAFFLLAGCATTRARKMDNSDFATQIQSMQAELQARDQQIQELRAQVDSYHRSLQPPAVHGKPAKSTVIRVSGVTPADVQKALARAGLDPGPVDGRIGRKTKAAIKEFQRKQGLKADGVVGEKTWSLLKS